MLQRQHVMSSLRAFGHAIPSRALRQLHTTRPAPTTRLPWTRCLPSLRRPEPVKRTLLGVLSRRATTAAARQARQGSGGTGFRYPAEINIYRKGSVATSAIGILRATLVMFWAGSTFIMFPWYSYAYFFPGEITSDKERPVQWYIPLLFLLASPIPAAAAFLAFSPYIHQIHVRLPTLARKNQKELMRWAENVPRNTVLSISILRLAPWPTVQSASWEDLSRLPRSWTRLANLEHKPVRNDNYLQDSKGSRGARFNEWLARSVFGRFYVDRAQMKDKAGVPGVWDKMWPQIPMKGEREQRLAWKEEQKAQAKAPGPRVVPQRRVQEKVDAK